MPLQEAELNEWMNDPEQWVNDEDTDNEQWIFEIRVSFLTICPKSGSLTKYLQPCSERVLMQLSNQFPDVVPPLVLSLYNSFGCELSSFYSSTMK
jgi:hypothetical protein